MANFKFNPITGKLDLVGDASIDTTNFVTKFNSAETDTNLSIGDVVYMKSNGHIDKAIATGALTHKVVGLSAENKLATTSCKFINDADLTMADWTSVIGSTNLTPNAIYFLSHLVAGQLTTTPTTTTGEFIVEVGVALSVTTLAIGIKRSILL